MFSSNSTDVSATGPANYIEDVFSTYLYTGNGSTQTITNGIDLSTKGGLVWTKNRTSTTAGRNYHRWNDSARGVTFALESNLTDAQDNLGSGSISSFNTTGYTLGGTTYNNASDPWVSWTFRKQPKFFDIVTYTGNGAASRVISHNLGSAPGFIIKKATSAVEGWNCQPVAALGYNSNLTLNNTNANTANGTTYLFASGNATTLTTAVDPTYINATGVTYVVYLFAHNAGGFGLTGTDNVISCGSFTTDGSGNATVNLGYEPQWVMMKTSSTTGAWAMYDVMRGMPVGSIAANLRANSSDPEYLLSEIISPTATGFTASGLNPSNTHIYIAIRRGPMKVPTSGTSVFAIDTRHNTAPAFVSNFPVDMSTYRAKSGSDWYLQSRLTPNFLLTNSTAAENASPLFSATQFAYNTGWGDSGANISDLFSYMFKRAPSFFDEVCYTGTGSPTTRNHNLTVIPELVIIKSRSGTGNWSVASKVNATDYVRSLPGTGSPFTLNSTNASSQTVDLITGGQMAATTFVPYVLYGTSNDSEQSGVTYVAYLFATCAGVSKVGTYTGTGATQTISCGFTGGARFVLVKRTDSTGDWYVWDTARGMVSGTDPSLLLNSTAAEVNANSIYTTTGGFQIVSTAAGINASGGSYIFLAVA